MLGSSKKVITELEYRERTYARRGIYAGKDIKKGEVLTLENLSFLRPNITLGVEKIYEILGKKVTHNISKGTPIDISMLDEFKV